MSLGSHTLVNKHMAAKPYIATFPPIVPRWWRGHRVIPYHVARVHIHNKHYGPPINPVPRLRWPISYIRYKRKTATHVCSAKNPSSRVILSPKNHYLNILLFQKKTFSQRPSNVNLLSPYHPFLQLLYCWLWKMLYILLSTRLHIFDWEEHIPTKNQRAVHLRKPTLSFIQYTKLPYKNNYQEPTVLHWAWLCYNNGWKSVSRAFWTNSN